MNIRFRKEAADELASAVGYYNNERPGLGYEFAIEVRNTLKRIKIFPEAWPFLTPNIRRCIVKRFPFAVLYHIDKEYLLVIAVMHLKREPGYWKGRV